jgi:hypothetical protein
MSLDDELERLELALDDHYGGVENLEDALEETEDAQNALRHLVDVVNHQNIQAYSTEQVVHGVTNYLLDHRDHMDARALELKRNQDKLENVLDDYDPSRGNGLTRRQAMAIGAGGVLATVGGIWAVGESEGWGDTGTSSGRSGSNVSSASITNVNQIGSYLEDEVMGNDMLSAEANWGDLLNEYDSESGEFFPESDRTLEGLDITLNPDSHSEYGVSTGINGKTEYETRPLREDKAAESALEYFGEL